MLKRKQLESYSVRNIRKFLKENKDTLTTEEKQYIKDLIAQRRKENRAFAEKLVDSKLFSLAKTELRRRGEAERTKVGQQVFYEYDIVEVLCVMSEIVARLQK